MTFIFFKICKNMNVDIDFKRSNKWQQKVEWKSIEEKSES